MEVAFCVDVGSFDFAAASVAEDARVEFDVNLDLALDLLLEDFPPTGRNPNFFFLLLLVVRGTKATGLDILLLFLFRLCCCCSRVPVAVAVVLCSHRPRPNHFGDVQTGAPCPYHVVETSKDIHKRLLSDTVCLYLPVARVPMEGTHW